ncbi:hypothetical protein [Dokdonella immobilis]|uniref:Uncharacterized protein n=1 Tax=Dokdonella immobilis TaxID=578942 RepID=A0A1I5B8K9_9GAMM|nr:hypothetical protein [Dokdonella immobilis]SFN71026.1 hypothetical protein SAMN05216289_1554 [Dokdonella immobilis]
MFASETGRVAALSSSHCLFRSRDGTAHIMTGQVLQALGLCSEFRSLDEHVARIELAVSSLQGQRDAIRRTLEDLVRRGLLLRDEDYIARLLNAPVRTQAPFYGVLIRACDRPDRLAQLLGSLADYERKFGAGRRYVLLDDSAQPANVARHREQLRKFARSTGCEVRHVGQVEATRLAEAFTQAVPQAKHAVAPLLLRQAQAESHRFGGGRSRNIALALSAGARLILLDDDLILPLRRAETSRDGLDPDPNASAQPHFHSSMAQALESGLVIDEDPFEMHLHVCGQFLGARARGRYALSRDSLHGLSLDQLQPYAAESHIVTTHHGSYGSSRSESTLWLYGIADPVARAQFWCDQTSYLRNLGAHHLFYGVGQAQARAFSGFTPFALDNSRMLPCTNPIGRAEDSLGNALIHYCQPESVSLELPVAIGHVQEGLRERFENTTAARAPRVNDFLREFVRRQFASSRAEEPGQRLRFLSHELRDLAHARPGDRLESLREFRSYVHAGIVERLQHQLETAKGAPAYWQDDVRAIVNVQTRELLDAGVVPRLAEWPGDIDAAGCARALAKELSSLADACEHWPALWRFAATEGDKLLAAVGAPVVQP